LLEIHGSLFLHIPTFHNIFKKLILLCDVDLFWDSAYNCENSECINNKYLWQQYTIPAVYINATFVITNCTWFNILEENVNVLNCAYGMFWKKLLLIHVRSQSKWICVGLRRSRMFHLYFWEYTKQLDYLWKNLSITLKLIVKMAVMTTWNESKLINI
jgi:hypothetical protein